MQKEKLEQNINQIEDPRQQLVATLMSLRRLRDQSESTMKSKGSFDAERAILVNIPMIADLTDGDLKGTGSGRALSDDSYLQVGVSRMTDVEVGETRSSLFQLLNIAKAAGTVIGGRRLDAYIPVTIPETADGFKALVFLAQNTPIPEASSSPLDLTSALKLLRELDNQVFLAAKDDPQIQQGLLSEARNIAVKRFERLKQEEGSSQLREAALLLADQKLVVLRREHVEVEGAPRSYSKFEILANRIIDEEGLKDQGADIEAAKEAKLQKARERVIFSLVRRRGTERLVGMLGTDEQFCQAIAQRRKMTAEELKAAEPSVQRDAVNSVLFSKPILLSETDRRAFNGQKILDEEKDRLVRGLSKDPLVVMAEMSDEDLQAVRNGIPKISNSKSIFDIAKDRLRAKLAEEATDEELIEVLTQTVAGELLNARNSAAVDLAINSLGITLEDLVSNPEVVANQIQQIVEQALICVQSDCTIEISKLKAERKGKRVSSQSDQRTVFKILSEELSKPNPDQPLIIGKSEVVAVDVATKGAQKAIGVVQKLSDLDLLKVSSLDVKQAMVHKANTAIFVSLPVSERIQRFVHTRVLTEDAKGKYGWGDAGDIRDVTQCKVLTGLCLFSTSAVTAVGEDGGRTALTNPYTNGEINQPVLRIDIDKRIQPYEADSLLRLSEMINCLNPDKISSVALAVPRIEYWMYAMDAYEKGLIDPSLMLEYFDAVDQRAGRIVDLMTKRIRKPGLKINQVDPLQSVALSMVQSVERGEKGLLPGLIEHLSRKTELFKTEKIDSFSDLSYLSYVMGYLEQLDDQNELLIAVENPEEMGILNRTRTLIGSVSSGKTIVGLYPHTNMVMAQDPETVGPRTLYFFDPKDRLQSALREIVGANR